MNVIWPESTQGRIITMKGIEDFTLANVLLYCNNYNKFEKVILSMAPLGVYGIVVEKVHEVAKEHKFNRKIPWFNGG